MKQAEIENTIRELDSLTPPAQNDLFARCGIPSRADTLPQTAAPATHAPRRTRKPLTIGLAAALTVCLLTVGAVAAVNENREYREAVSSLEMYGISTVGMTRAEVKETWRRFTVRNDNNAGEVREAVIQGNELLLCTEDEAQAALLATAGDRLGQKDSALYTRLYGNLTIGETAYTMCLSDGNGNDYSDTTKFAEGTCFVGLVKNQYADNETWVWRTDVTPLRHANIYEYGDKLIVTGITKLLSDANGRVSVLCLSADTGKILWRTDFLPDGAVSALPMAVLTDADGVTLFCRAECANGPRLSRQYRLAAVRLTKDGDIGGVYQSELTNLFTVKDAKALSHGWFVCLEDLAASESNEKYPYEFLYLDEAYEIRNRYRLTIGEALAAYESEEGTAYTPSAFNSLNIGSTSAAVSVTQIEMCNDIIWMSGSAADLYIPEAYQPVNGEDAESNPLGVYRLWSGQSNALIQKLRKQCVAYLLAWDPMAGEVKYFCTAPGCLIPCGSIAIRTADSGDVSWTVCSVVGYQPVSAYISSMTAFVTVAVYDNVFSAAGDITSQYLGGTVIRY